MTFHSSQWKIIIVVAAFTSSCTIIVTAVGMPSPDIYASYFHGEHQHQQEELPDEEGQQKQICSVEMLRGHNDQKCHDLQSLLDEASLIDAPQNAVSLMAFPQPRILPSKEQQHQDEEQQQEEEEEEQQQQQQSRPFQILRGEKDLQIQDSQTQMQDEGSILRDAPKKALPLIRESQSRESLSDVVECLSRLERRLAVIEEYYSNAQQQQEQHQVLLRNGSHRPSVLVEAIRLFVVSAVPVLSMSVILGASFLGFFHIFFFLLELSKPCIDVARQELRRLRLRTALFAVKVLNEFQPSLSS